MGTKTFRQLTTFRIGGRIKHFFEVSTKKEVVSAVSFAKKNKLPIFILGGGSDILVSDSDFNGLVIRYVGDGVNFQEKDGEVFVTVEAGMGWDSLVKLSVERNLQGLESLSGIPGTVGASPIQNIGAYGQELKDTFASLSAYDIETQQLVNFSKKDCRFSYRESTFKSPENKGRFIICDVTLKLKKNTPPKVLYDSLKKYLAAKKILRPTLLEVRQAILDLRKQRLPDYRRIPNAGSFFKNPIVDRKKANTLRKKHPEMPFFAQDKKSVKLFAAWLIEKAGWKGKSFGKAAVSTKNALVLTNPKGKATAKEVKKLAEKISEDVYKKFGVKLEPEVQYIGFD